MRIQNKLFSYFLLFSVVLVVLSLLLVQAGLDRGMLDYVNARETRAINHAIEGLSRHYQENGSWDALKNNHRIFRRVVENALRESGIEHPHPPLRGPGHPPPGTDGKRPPRHPDGSHKRPGDAPERPAHLPPSVGPRHGLLDKDKTLIVGKYQPDVENNYIEIKVDSEVVGYVAISKHKRITEGYELNFVDQLNQYLLFIGIFLILLTTVLTLPLARHLTRPIRKITASMNNLTQGHYDELFTEDRDDELGILARDVNELARTLKQNQTARQRWLADVSHELRTPTAILQAHIDAMLDGVRPLDKEQLASANEELKQLQRLIDDLHELARSDIGTQHYRKRTIDLFDHLPGWLESHKIELLKRGITLRFTSELHACEMHGDPGRLKQLFDNLLSNTAKYAQHADRVDIKLFGHDSYIDIVLEDNGEGVAEEALPLLFDHMYRAHSDTENLTAGSGIGLAICKKIVEAHNGEIMPFQSTLGGLGISIRFRLR